MCEDGFDFSVYFLEVTVLWIVEYLAIPVFVLPISRCMRATISCYAIIGGLCSLLVPISMEELLKKKTEYLYDEEEKNRNFDASV